MAKIGAAIGREFSYALLASVMRQPASPCPLPPWRQLEFHFEIECHKSNMPINRGVSRMPPHLRTLLCGDTPMGPMSPMPGRCSEACTPCIVALWAAMSCAAIMPSISSFGPNGRTRWQRSRSPRMCLPSATADDLEHVGSGGLLLQRFAQLRGPPLEATPPS